MPIRGKRNHGFKGAALSQVQENFTGVEYLIIDEYSVISQRELSWINRRCKQATGVTETYFGGINVILVEDLGQLPPVNGKILYHKNPSNEHDSEGYFLYCHFNTVIELIGNELVSGDNSDQERFRDLLTNVRNGIVTVDDWNLLKTRTPLMCDNIDTFNDALKLSYGNKKVAEDNFQSLKNLGIPIAKIKAVNNKAAASKLSSDDMGVLSLCVFLSVGARVMLTRNLWTEVGLCNWALETVYSIIYMSNVHPPSLPVAVMVKFDTYSGPSFFTDVSNCVPIPPCSSTSESLGSNFERTQFPLKLAWSITIHKSQGLTLPKVWIDLGNSERSPGLSYVAFSRVRALNNLVVEPMTLKRLQDISKTSSFQFRIEEEQRLHETAFRS